jgi:hypothetical protein
MRVDLLVLPIMPAHYGANSRLRKPAKRPRASRPPPLSFRSACRVRTSPLGCTRSPWNAKVRANRRPSPHSVNEEQDAGERPRPFRLRP